MGEGCAHAGGNVAFISPAERKGSLRAVSTFLSACTCSFETQVYRSSLWRLRALRCGVVVLCSLLHSDSCSGLSPEDKAGSFGLLPKDSLLYPSSPKAKGCH